MNALPAVTVLMPVFNAESFLPEAIESILKQTFSDFELLMINDCSTDRSVEIINSYKDSRIRLVSNEKNIKLIATLNKGLEIARGKYIARMDADDISHRERIEKQVRFMESHPDVGLCSCWFETFGNGNKIVNYPEHNDDIRIMLLYQSPFCHASVVYRTEVLRKIDFRYSTDFIHAEDLEAWVTLAGVTRIANVPEVLYRVRMHHSSVSSVHSNIQQENTLKALRIQFEKIGLNVSDSEISLFREIAYSNFNAERKYIEQAERLLSALADANKKSGYLPQKALNRFVFEKWFHLCFNATSLGRWVYRCFHQSSLSGLGKVTFAQQVKFALKANLNLR